MLEEVFSIVDEIVEDGELTKDEIRQLINWINSHPQFRKEWPVNVLHAALKTALADKQLSTEELYQLSLLVQSIQREKARQDLADGEAEASVNDDENARQKQAVLNEGLADFDPYKPMLATFGVKCKVQSHSDPSTRYEVNLLLPECSCPDFLKHRKSLPEGHIGRCCKHTFELYAFLRAKDGWPFWLESFLEQAWVPQPGLDWGVFKSNKHPVLFSSIGGGGWADVHAPDDQGVYRRFGYNAHETRWAYKNEPPNAKAIIRRIK